jgi:agmatine/peptidylarginine deiminase
VQQMYLSASQYERSKAAYDVLAASTDAKGRNIEVVKMPVPPPQHITEVTCPDTACPSQWLKATGCTTATHGRPVADLSCSRLHQQEESAGIMKAKGAMPREPGTRLAAS